jgi:hypothetical protein
MLALANGNSVLKCPAPVTARRRGDKRVMTSKVEPTPAAVPTDRAEMRETNRIIVVTWAIYSGVGPLVWTDLFAISGLSERLMMVVSSSSVFVNGREQAWPAAFSGRSSLFFLGSRNQTALKARSRCHLIRIAIWVAKMVSL